MGMVDTLDPRGWLVENPRRTGPRCASGGNLPFFRAGSSEVWEITSYKLPVP